MILEMYSVHLTKRRVWLPDKSKNHRDESVQHTHTHTHTHTRARASLVFNQLKNISMIALCSCTGQCFISFTCQMPLLTSVLWALAWLVRRLLLRRTRFTIIQYLFIEAEAWNSDAAGGRAAGHASTGKLRGKFRVQAVQRRCSSRVQTPESSLINDHPRERDKSLINLDSRFSTVDTMHGRHVDTHYWVPNRTLVLVQYSIVCLLLDHWHHTVGSDALLMSQASASMVARRMILAARRSSHKSSFISRSSSLPIHWATSLFISTANHIFLQWNHHMQLVL